MREKEVVVPIFRGLKSKRESRLAQCERKSRLGVSGLNKARNAA